MADRTHYELGTASRLALRGLGVNIEAPVAQYHAAYERFLPEAAVDGVHGLLANAGVRRSVDAELRWLAKHLVVRAPMHGDVWWNNLWSQAARELPENASPPEALGTEARHVLLTRLLDAEAKAGLVNALAAAMQVERSNTSP